MRRSIGEMIEAALTKRGNLLAYHEAIDTRAITAGAVLTDEDTANKAKLEELVAAVNDELRGLRKRETLLASCAETDTEIRTSVLADKSAADTIEAGTVKNKGATDWTQYGLALMAHALHKGQGDAIRASHYAKQVLGNDSLASVLEFQATHGSLDEFQNGLIRASDPGVGTTADAAFVGALVEFRRAANMFIELWRPKTILGRASTIGLSFGIDGTITIPRQTAGTTGAWVAEALAIPVGNIQLDEIDLSPREQGTIVIVSKRALDHSNPSALSVIQADLIEAAARNVDATWLDAVAGSAARPRGGFANAASSTPSNLAGTVLDDIDADLKNSLDHFSDNDIPEVGMAWQMHPGAKRAIQFVRDGNGNRVFPEVANGMLEGIPIIDSTQQTRTTVDLVAFGHVIMADDYGPMIDLSNDATVHRETVPDEDLAAATPTQSMFQTNSTAIRLTQGIDWERRRDTVCHRITAVNW